MTDPVALAIAVAVGIVLSALFVIVWGVPYILRGPRR